MLKLNQLLKLFSINYKSICLYPYYIYNLVLETYFYLIKINAISYCDISILSISCTLSSFTFSRSCKWSLPATFRSERPR